MKQTLNKLKSYSSLQAESASFVRSWFERAPWELRTPEAYKLFYAAFEADIICPPELEDYFIASRGVTKGQLAYWCKKASTYLKLDKGNRRLIVGDRDIPGEPLTNWTVFDAVFGYVQDKNKSLRFSYQSMLTTTDPQRSKDIIDKFFSELEAQDNDTPVSL